ncbi:Siderophore iron transporter [Wickerhamomyces ciferrii]|uniref:Siderophore iron transporter n=1 Tax=Wickerhamomyces ciferrii (strain ATCC 14091 / BCRC 22168 / CBS 111 / JCM 3599 / NBRC 0793 / NRRL Y-1031 F-60-10) TaxID=1206466 RepID=K0KVR3_WICCF|nr:Siderophore iron transporter [Wickerhamomyces ciferrii]CCH46047.1 Siderophore iron transporter [Wickerhamomyces ciferrii]
MSEKNQFQVDQAQQVHEINDNGSSSDIVKEKTNLSDSEKETPLYINDDTDTSSQHKVYHSRGVQRAENVKVLMDSTKNGKFFRIIMSISLLICAWVYTLDSSTTYNYGPYATSQFNKHSMLSTLQIATKIMGSVCKPMLAKFSDVTSRPATYILALVLYTLGYIVVASSKTISAYIIGEVFVAIGGSGISLMNSIIAADLTPLKYRGLLIGILGSPYLITTWFSGLIVEAILGRDHWRWGYGMFAIIMPVAISPAIIIMMWLDNKADKLAKENAKLNAPETLISTESITFTQMTRQEKLKFIWQQTLEIDLIGLILMGFGWSLLLLPFSLYKNADNQWKNPSMIAMIVVGGIFLIIYTIYEFTWAPYPSMPKRVLINRTFMTAVCVDFFYMFGGMLKTLYFSSYVYVIKDWSYQNWTYYNNTMTMGLCFFGVIVGIIQRYTQRTKWLQVFGLALQIVAKGIVFWARYDNASTAALVWVQLLIGIGGACSVVGSQVASQASVPHQDTALVISLLSQWSSIGNAIGSAVGSAIWSNKVPYYLRKNLPSSVTDKEIAGLFGSITKIRNYPWDSEIRQGAVKSYFDAVYYLYIPALGIAFIPLIVALFQKNFYLGDHQNAVEHKNVDPRSGQKPTGFFGKIKAFFDEPLTRTYA